MGGTSWSQCIDLGAKLQNGEHGVVDEIKKVDEVDFQDFVELWGTLEPRRANDEIQAVKSVLRIIQHLKIVWLRFCNLGADHLRILCDVFNGVKINKLNISCSIGHNTDADIWRQLGILVHRCGLKTLDALDCNLTTECLERFIQGLNGAQINKLEISYNDIDAETWRQLGILVHQCGLKTLVAWNCSPTAVCLKRFIQGLNGAQINKLDISCNDIDAETWRQLGILVRQCGLKTLMAWKCHLTAECLERFIQGLNGAQFNKLDISGSLRHNIDAETWRQLGILVHQCGLKTLKALDCNLTAECLERFIQGTNGAQIYKLDISLNDIDSETWRQLGILVHHCGLKTLKADDCPLTAECLERFIQETNGAQFDELSINANDLDVCHLIGRIVHQCGLKKLWLRSTTSRGLKKLVQRMNGTRLDHIVITVGNEDNFPITGVLKLLPLINEKLEIAFENREIDEGDVGDLQEKLDDDHLRSFTIKYGSVYLKASPMDLSPNLPKVEGLELDETNGSVLLKWSPLSIPNVSYYIVVENDKDGKAVGGPIITNETRCQLSYLQSETKYSFFIWGYTNDAISSRVTWECLETGEIYEHQQTIQPGVLQTIGERSSDVLDTEANKQGNSEASALGQMQTLNDWLDTAGQFESPMQSQLRENSQQGVIKTVEATNNTVVWNGNMGALQGSDNPTHRNSAFDVEQFILFRHAQGSLFSRAATSTAPAVPYASAHANMQQTYIQQDTSNYGEQQPQQYPARDDGMMYNSADQGFQQPAMPVVNNPAPVSQDTQRAATFTAPAVPYASVHANMQQTYIQKDTSNYVQQPSQPYSAAADGTTHNSADQGFQQPVQPVANNPAPVLQESQRFDANTSTEATEFTQLTTVNPSADYDMGASAAYGYPVDQSGGNVYQPTVDRAAAFSMVQTHNNDMNAYQTTANQTATFSMDQTFNNDVNAHQQTADQAAANSMVQTTYNDMNAHQQTVGQAAANSMSQTPNIDLNAYQQTADQAVANSMGQTSNNAVNDHPSNSGQIAANSLDQTSNIESDAVRARLDKLESLVASFQNMVKMQDEKLKMQNQEIFNLKKEKESQDQMMKVWDAKMKEQEETITKLEKKVAALEGAGASASVDVCQLPFILPMKTKDDVEENENLLEEKENETKLVELLSKVGGTGRVAVWRIMGKLFTDRLAKQYSWTGRKAGKNPLRKLKMKEIIFRTGVMKNVDNEPCEKAVMRWLKNASDREGGRERRNKRKGEKSGAKQTE